MLFYAHLSVLHVTLSPHEHRPLNGKFTPFMAIFSAKPYPEVGQAVSRAVGWQGSLQTKSVSRSCANGQDEDFPSTHPSTGKELIPLLKSKGLGKGLLNGGSSGTDLYGAIGRPVLIMVALWKYLHDKHWFHNLINSTTIISSFTNYLSG